MGDDVGVGREHIKQVFPGIVPTHAAKDQVDVPSNMLISTHKRTGHSSSIALDRFLLDPRRKTCSFVNLSSDALENLVETAQQNQLVLTQVEEQNVGSVVRLTWPRKADVDPPAAALGKGDADDPVYCPRCQVPSFADGVCGRIALCAKCKGGKTNGSTKAPPFGLPTIDSPSLEASPSPCVLPPEMPGLPEASTPKAMGMSRMRSFATQRIVNEVRDAVADSHKRPELTAEGTGGVYLIRRRSKEGDARGQAVGVFKPSDEAAGCENNPRGLKGEECAMREGFPHGGAGGAARERVAYQLDKGFAGVPPTAVETLLLRTRTGTRICEQSGSVQAFVPSEGDASDYRFDGSDFDPSMCQRVALMDCRLFNTDRHEGNILVRTPRAAPVPTTLAPPPAPSRADEEEFVRTPLTSEILAAARAAAEDAVASSAATVIDVADGAGLESSPTEPPKREIVPIDHAFILPRFGYFREAEFAWRYWGAAQQPFGPEAARYAAAIDVEADVEVARRAGLDASSCATLRVSTMLVRAALLGAGTAQPAQDGGEMTPTVTPRELAGALMREAVDVPSPLERLCARALGVTDEEQLESDTALIDLVVRLGAEAQQQEPEPPAQQRGREPTTTPAPASFVPSAEFYVRFAALLEEMYGPVAMPPTSASA